MAAYSCWPKNAKNGTITLMAAVASLEIAYEVGDLSFDEVAQFTEEVYRDRGNISNVTEGDEQVVTGTFTFFTRQFTDETQGGSGMDFLKKRGFYATNTSVAGTVKIKQYAIDIVYDVEGLSLGDDSDHSATLKQCVLGAISFTEGNPSQFSVPFTAYGGIDYVGPVIP